MDSWNALLDAQCTMVNLACNKATINPLADGGALEFAIIKQNEADGVQIKI